jgi:hypothetical protein
VDTNPRPSSVFLPDHVRVQVMNVVRSTPNRFPRRWSRADASPSSRVLPLDLIVLVV